MRFLAIPLAMVLLTLAATPALATFPGRNGEIAFVRSGDIWAIEADGTGLHQITSDPGAESSPAWSPDGSRVAFARAGNGNTDIWTADAHGSDAVQVTTTADDEDQPTWAPDGKRLAYSRIRAAIMGYDLYVANADGSGEHLIREAAVEADWSPTGDRIAVRAGLDDASRIALVGPDGQDLGDLPTIRNDDFGGGMDLWPSWAPDGSRLAYSRGRYDDQGAFHFDLAVNPLATTEPVVQPGDTDYFLPTWSPDGTAIAYSLRSQVWIVPRDGGEPRQVTTGPAGAIAPAWRPLPPVTPAPVAPVVQAPVPSIPTRVVPVRRARVLHLGAPLRARAGQSVAVVLRVSGAVTGPLTLQRKVGKGFVSVASARLKGHAATLRVRAGAVGRLHLRVVFRTGGVLIRKPLSVLVLPAR